MSENKAINLAQYASLWQKCKDTFALLTHSHSAMTGATVNADGGAGFAPAPAVAERSKYLRGDGTWAEPTDTTYGAMSGATAEAGGAAGLAPAPAAGDEGKYLRGDGTWATPTNTTYGVATSLTAGLMSATDKQKLDGLEAGSGGGSGGGGTSVEWTFGLAESLPATVPASTVVAIVADASVPHAVGDTAPATPAVGDVWFHVDDIGDKRLLTSGACEFWLYGAYQWDGSAWSLLPTYMSFLGSWEQLDGLPPLGATLENCSWAQIDTIGAEGLAADYFCVGDTKTVTLTTGETITLRIIDFAHDDLTSGDKAPITFDMVDCLATQCQMYATQPVPTYGNSVARNWLINAVYPTLPAELRDVIKPVNKKAAANLSRSALETISEHIFIPCEAELSAAVIYAMAGEGTLYAYYASAERRIKEISGTAARWWTRSVYSQYCYADVTASGAIGYPGNLLPEGISFALCV